MRKKFIIIVLVLFLGGILGSSLFLTYGINSEPLNNNGGYDPAINSTAYDNSGTQVLSAGQIFWVYFNPLPAGTTVYMWAQTANTAQGVDVFVCNEDNLNEYVAGRSATVYCLHQDVHISTDSFTAPTTEKWYFVWSNRDSLGIKSVDWFLDTNGDDIPSYSGHYWVKNGQSMEPGGWYYVSSSLSQGESINGYFKSWINTDALDFFICDQANYTSWAGGGGATVFHLKDNYISAPWGPFTIPYADTWYCVYSAKDAPDTVTFSAYMDKEAARTITVTSPSGSSSWMTGSGHYITWSSTGSISFVRIELYKNTNLISILTSSTSNDGLFFWTLPSNLISGIDYRIKIIYTADSGIFDYSSYFEIIQIPTITITNPTGYSSWIAGNNYTIQWSSTGNISNVKLELYNGFTFISTIADTTANNGSFFWTIPSYIGNGYNYRIKTTSTSDSNIYDYSAYFEIINLTYNRPPIPGFTWILGLLGIFFVVLFIRAQDNKYKAMGTRQAND